MKSRINEIQARLNAATRTPWECDGFADGDHVNLGIYEGSNQGRVIADHITRQGDAALLLNAPIDIAYLLAALAEAWEEGKDAGLNGGWDNPYEVTA